MTSIILPKLAIDSASALIPSVIAVDLTSTLIENMFPATETQNSTTHPTVGSSAPAVKMGASIADLYDLASLKERRITGKGVKIAIFDSGLADAFLTDANYYGHRNLNAEAMTLTNPGKKLASYEWDEDDSDDDLESDPVSYGEEAGWAHPTVGSDAPRSAASDMRVVQVIDFTRSGPADQIGHGTFITSVIASEHESCPGLAPDAEVYVFKTFSNDH